MKNSRVSREDRISVTGLGGVGLETVEAPLKSKEILEIATWKVPLQRKLFQGTALPILGSGALSNALPAPPSFLLV
jgi:hypothetical protein